MYELANLYYKTGRREDCIKTCDNLVLWFQDGVYVENAVKLKEKLGVNLSNTQRRILGEINARKSDEEANKERMLSLIHISGARFCAFLNNMTERKS